MSHTFNTGTLIYRAEVPFTVVQTLENGKVDLKNMLTGAHESADDSALQEEYCAGKLEIRTKESERKSLGHIRHSRARMDLISKQCQAETMRRIDYLVRTERAGWTDLDVVQKRKLLNQIATERKEAWPPHESSIWRWRRRYIKAGNDIRAVFHMACERGGKGQSRLDPSIEALLVQQIDATLERSHSWSAENVLDGLRHEINLKNAELPRDEHMTVPALRTVQRRLAQLPAYDLIAAKHGVKEANRRFAPLGPSRKVSRILELVEIDHTPLDVILVNEHGESAERPMLTLVMDRYSRCILGYHIAPNGWGTESVFEAIKHALLPKTYLSKQYADLGLVWPCFGWFLKILMDNGREFHSHAVGNALLNIGIIAEYARSRQPNDKPFVERLLKTINYSLIHKLPGTTLAKQHLRVGFRSENEAAMTLEDLDRTLHVWICNKYHRRPHVGLGKRTPLEVWNESAMASPPQLKFNAQDLDIEFGQRTTSTLQKYGIDLETFRFHSPRLLDLIKALPPRFRVEVKWTKDHAGWIFVWDPMEKEFFKVPNTDDDFRHLTMAQARLVKAKRSSSKDHDAPLRASAEGLINEEVDRLKKAKELKDRRAGAKLAAKTSKHARQATSNAGGDDLADTHRMQNPAEVARPMEIPVHLSMEDEVVS